MRGLMVVVCGEGFQQEIALCLVPRVPSRSGPRVSIQSQSSNSQFQLGHKTSFPFISEEGPRYSLLALTIESVKRLILNYTFYCKWSEVKSLSQSMGVISGDTEISI